MDCVWIVKHLKTERVDRFRVLGTTFTGLTKPYGHGAPYPYSR